MLATDERAVLNPVIAAVGCGGSGGSYKEAATRAPTGLLENKLVGFAHVARCLCFNGFFDGELCLSLLGVAFAGCGNGGLGVDAFGLVVVWLFRDAVGAVLALLLLAARFAFFTLFAAIGHLQFGIGVGTHECLLSSV